MSSMSISLTRKRLRSPDFRDSDDDSVTDIGAPPPKLRKENYRFSLMFKEKLQGFAVWLNDLPVKSFFSMALKSGNRFQTEDLLDDDEEENEEEDDDDDVIIQKVVKADPEKLKPLMKKFGQKRYSSSDRRHLERNGSYPISSYYDPHESSSRDWNSRYNRNGDCRSSKKQTDNGLAMISNPKNEIEVYLGAKPKVLAHEVDDIEILSESPSTKQKHVSLKKSRVASTSTAKNSVFDNGHTWDSTLEKKLQFSSRKEFTANEVVRLQEKEQYKLLLDKFISGSSFYHPSVKKLEVKDVGTQANEKKFPLSGIHFKKEVIQQPMDKLTLEKYFKPCHLLTLEEAKKEATIETVKIDDEDEDDELQILKVTLPKCKTPKLKSTSIFSPEWLRELKQSVTDQSIERIKISEAHEHQLEEYRKQRLRKQLDFDAPASQAVDLEFPELTPEMDEAVDAALNVGPPEEPLCKITSDHLLRKDFETLGGLNWLNDLVINSYFDLIKERSKQEGYPSIHAYNTFFYSNYKTKGYHGVKRWTRKLDIFSYDLNFIPIHLGVHWCLAVIDHRSKKVCYYDSMGNGEEQCLDLLHKYLCMEYVDKKKGQLEPSTYTTEKMKDIPQQMNGSDCGMFTLKYAEYISRDAEITFNQSHMQYFRRRMVYELLKSQLL